MSLGTIAFTRVNALLESGGVGRIEDCVLTFDGNTEGRDAAKFQGVDMFYKVSDKILTAEELERSTVVVVEPDGSETVLTAEQLFTIDSSAYGLPAGLFVGLGDNPHGPLVASGKACNESAFYAPSDGTYFISHPEYGHRLHKLSFKTIVPIDPKFLPKPTVTDMTALGLTEDAFFSESKLPVDDVIIKSFLDAKENLTHGFLKFTDGENEEFYRIEYNGTYNGLLMYGGTNRMGQHLVAIDPEGKTISAVKVMV